MGVRHLNQYLIKQCPFGIKTVSIDSFKGKKIVIDTSIYMYKYKAAGSLFELMKHMIIMLQEYFITPIFIFDGKPKQNKNLELKHRREQKEIAWTKYKKLSEEEPLSLELVKLKQQCTKISKLDIINIKELMDSLGVVYIVAPNEADEVCANFMAKGYAYACMSDDMDMLIHGCTYILRNVNFQDNTTQLYELPIILKYLKMSHKTFKQICVLSGTDYYKTSGNLFTYLKLYSQFLKSDMTDFYEWLKTYNLIENYESLIEAYDAFDAQKNDFTYIDTYAVAVTTGATAEVAF